MKAEIVPTSHRWWLGLVTAAALVLALCIGVELYLGEPSTPNVVVNHPDFARDNALQRRADQIRVYSVSVRQAVAELQHVYHVSIVLDESDKTLNEQGWLDRQLDDEKVTISLHNASLETALRLALLESPLEFSIDNGGAVIVAIDPRRLPTQIRVFDIAGLLAGDAMNSKRPGPQSDLQRENELIKVMNDFFCLRNGDGPDVTALPGKLLLCGIPRTISSYENCLRMLGALKPMHENPATLPSSDAVVESIGPVFFKDISERTAIDKLIAMSRQDIVIDWGLISPEAVDEPIAPITVTAKSLADAIVQVYRHTFWYPELDDRTINLDPETGVEMRGERNFLRIYDVRDLLPEGDAAGGSSNAADRLVDELGRYALGHAGSSYGSLIPHWEGRLIIMETVVAHRQIESYLSMRRAHGGRTPLGPTTPSEQTGARKSTRSYDGR